jgi:Tfp pilus assembly protein PilP
MASAPPPPPIEVKLTGVFRVGKELRASLTINGQSVVVRKGDATAAGKVAKIDGNAIVILSSGERRLEMYR